MGPGPTPSDPLAEMIRESRSRLPLADQVQCRRTGEFYEIKAARGGASAGGKLRARFWEEYLASGNQDHCECVEHFFDHLDRRLGEEPPAGVSSTETT